MYSACATTSFSNTTRSVAGSSATPAGHEQKLAGARRRGAVGKLLVPRPSRIDHDGNVAGGGEVVSNQRFGMQQAWHENTRGARINRTEPFAAHATGAFVAGEGRGVM